MVSDNAGCKARQSGSAAFDAVPGTYVPYGMSGTPWFGTGERSVISEWMAEGVAPLSGRRMSGRTDGSDVAFPDAGELPGDFRGTGEISFTVPAFCTHDVKEQQAAPHRRARRRADFFDERSKWLCAFAPVWYCQYAGVVV